VVAQTSLFRGVTGIDVGQASALEDMMGPSGKQGGFQGDGLAVMYGKPGSRVRRVWGARNVVAYWGAYASNVLINIRSRNIRQPRISGLFFFTPLFLHFLDQWAEREEWLQQLKDYRTAPQAMDKTIGAIFSFDFLRKDGWCVRPHPIVLWLVVLLLLVAAHKL